MKRHLTSNDLIRFAYRETPALEIASVSKGIKENSEMKREFLEITKTKNLLNAESYKPSQTSVRIIMDYSRKTQQLEFS